MLLIKQYFTLLFLAVISFSVAADDFPERPNPPRLVNDFARVLTQAENNHLERKLVDYFAATSTQIAIVTVKSLDGYDKSDYATRLAHNWGIGIKGSDNGILILVKPKTHNSNGQVFVAIGYGLEGAVPDAIANRDIVDAELIPYFKQNDYFTGLDKATTVLIGLTKGEFSAAQYHQQVKKRKSGGGSGFFLLFLLFFVIIPVLRRKRRATGIGRSLPFWAAMTMMSSGRHSHGGLFNDFSSGGGSFGGGSSFGGFGGGGFGGGGAGGSW